MDDDKKGIIIDDLRVILTRPSTIVGVPSGGVILNFTIATAVFVFYQKLQYWAMFFPVHGIFFLVCMKDPRAFELLALWMCTKLVNLWRTIWYWGASTYSPLLNHKAPGFLSRRRFAKLKGK